MNDINFEREMQKTIEKVKAFSKKPKLLLHACCAPCASSVVERLMQTFDITLYFYNPNMDSSFEYQARANEILKLSQYFGIEQIIEKYDEKEFLSEVTGFEKEKEGGDRCDKCFSLRLNKTASVAKEKDFDYFATTLTLSPLKNAKKLNVIGQDVERVTGVKYLVSDFKKKNGYVRSIELSKQLGLYRQNYCGCIFSKEMRFQEQACQKE